jgi:hypothetical protein
MSLEEQWARSCARPHNAIRSISCGNLRQAHQMLRRMKERNALFGAPSNLSSTDRPRASEVRAPRKYFLPMQVLSAVSRIACRRNLKWCPDQFVGFCVLRFRE